MKLNRRQFAASLAASALPVSAAPDKVDVLVTAYADNPQVKWAIEDLKSALGDRLAKTTDRATMRLRIGAPASQPLPKEAYQFQTVTQAIPTVQLTATAPEGMCLGVLELADRARHNSPWPQSGIDSPFLKVRGNMRLFCSEVEDKPWFYDRTMWPEYFAMLATNRFNRFQLAFGIGYDFLREVTDAYGLFPYPFFLTDVPGYKVRARNLPDGEAAKNLETLRYISDQCAAHGIHFQLGLWMHGYVWENSPKANYVIEGLSGESHGPYCHDALRQLLKSCPNINGVTFRIHGESGVTEGSYDFWKQVFEGATKIDRPIQLDLHAKGIDQKMIDTALSTGLPVQVSPKFWAEHMGLPYLQSSIRELEMPKAQDAKGLMALSAGTRSFTRYSYADLLRADRQYTVLHRIWPGTQRLLLWGDPEFAGAYARAFSTAESDGVEIMEPLSFKGRRGSGIPGGRCGYADASLNPKWDWEKYRYSYRVWGRHLYNPTPDPDVYRRELRTEYGADAAKVEKALASASRILPLVTSAHAPSAANNAYWPEMYTNQPMVDAKRKQPYSDTPSPKVFGNATSFDPELFLTVKESAGAATSAKYSAIDVAGWLDQLAADASAADLSKYRRLSIDLQMQAGLARYFAARFRAGVLYSFYEKTRSETGLTGALRHYREARAHWAKLAATAKGVYVPDLTVGELECLRGHWLDRLAAIDQDIADMQGQSSQKSEVAAPSVSGNESPRVAPWRHVPASPTFKPGAAVAISITAESAPSLHYRHLNQGERWQSLEMTREADGRYRAEIPASYTSSPFHLQYYFSATKPWPLLYPGLGPRLSQQPYFIVEQHS